MAILQDKLALIDADIVRAENNKRVADNKLNDLLSQRTSIVTMLNAVDGSTSVNLNVTQAIDILTNASSLTTISLVKAEVIKAKDVLNKKDVSISEVKI